MSDYKWNEVREPLIIWNPDSQKIEPSGRIRSDKSVINDIGGVKFEDALEALCRVVSELVELEEKRPKERFLDKDGNLI